MVPQNYDGKFVKKTLKAAGITKKPTALLRTIGEGSTDTAYDLISKAYEIADQVKTSSPQLRSDLFRSMMMLKNFDTSRTSMPEFSKHFNLVMDRLDRETEERSKKNKLFIAQKYKEANAFLAQADASSQRQAQLRQKQDDAQIKLDALAADRTQNQAEIKELGQIKKDGINQLNEMIKNTVAPQYQGQVTAADQKRREAHKANKARFQQEQGTNLQNATGTAQRALNHTPGVTPNHDPYAARQAAEQLANMELNRPNPVRQLIGRV